MKTSNLVAAAVFALALSVLAGSLIISAGLRADAAARAAAAANTPPGPLLTESGLAKYLGISYSQAVQLGPLPNDSGATNSVLPFVKIGNAIFFPRAAVDKWLQSR